MQREFSPMFNNSKLDNSMVWKSEESQSKGSKANEGAYIMVLARFVSLGVVVMPQLMSTYGLKTFVVSLTIVMALHLFCAWMIQKSIAFFKRESMKISDMSDLTFLCFTDEIVNFRLLMKVLSSICLIISLNTFLGNETEAVFKLVTDKNNDKYQLLGKLAINIVSIPFLYTNFVSQRKLQNIGLLAFCLCFLILTGYSFF